MRGFAVNLHVQPDHTIMTAADGVAFTTFADHGIISAKFTVLSDPAGPESAISLLVCHEGDLDIKIRADPGLLKRLDGTNNTRDCPFHISGPATIDPTALDDGVKGRAMPPLTRDGDDVVVSVKVNSFFGACIPEANDIVTRVSEQVRQGFLLQRAGNRDSPNFKAEIF